MTLPASGALSLSQVNTEFGLSGSISLARTDVRSLAGVSSGAISQSSLYGKTFVNATHQLTQFISDTPTVDAKYGTVLAMDALGETLVVGAMNDATLGATAGAVYIYTQVGSSWSLHSKLYASDGATTYKYGQGVAISADGQTLFVGSPGWKYSVSSAVGAVYIYKLISGVWVQQQFIQLNALSIATINGVFGTGLAVSGDGNYLAVGEPGRTKPTGSVSKAGAVHTFVLTAGTWTYQSVLYAGTVGVTDLLGTKVAINYNGTTLTSGCPTSNSNQGMLVTWVRTGVSWAQQHIVRPTVVNTYLSNSVSISNDGNTVISASGLVNGFGLYVYSRSGTAWTQQVKLYTIETGSNVGTWGVLSSDGNTLLVGDSWNTVPSIKMGAVFKFTRTGSVWTKTDKFVPADGVLNDLFGTVLAASADCTNFAVRASTPTPDFGTVYLFG